MSETNETSSSSPLPPESTVARKPVVVRVRRRLSQARLDAFWLEINEKPAKRSFSDLEALSISDSAGKDIEKLKRRKLLVQHVETINNSEAAKDVLQSFLPDIEGTNSVQKKIEERRSKLKIDKKQEHLRSTARKKHEDLVRNARFQQIWNSRRGKEANDEEVLHEMCHLYDVVRVDNVEENSKNAEKTKSEGSYKSLEENAILCNYLPLLREFIPSAAEEIEFDVTSSLPKEDNYVYDLYTVEDGVSENMEHSSTEYPLVQVDHEDDYYDGPDHSDYETDDSNAEDNPNNDYPDEESSEDEGREEMDLYGEDVERSQYEDEEVYVSEEEENQKWAYR